MTLVFWIANLVSSTSIAGVFFTYTQQRLSCVLNTRFRSSRQWGSVKKVFLEISQSPQEYTCARVYFLIKLQASYISFCLPCYNKKYTSKLTSFEFLFFVVAVIAYSVPLRIQSNITQNTDTFYAVYNTC